LFIEACLAKSNWQEALLALTAFVKELEIHFNAEENFIGSITFVTFTLFIG